MERLSQGLNHEKKELKISVVRHGPSVYKQPDWDDIETADDLNTVRYPDSKTSEEITQGKKDAVEIIRQAAEEIAAEIEPDEEVAIWSSPTGRTLETARIIRDILKEKNVNLREGVEIFKKLGEVKNFSWQLFEPLMNGGEVEYNGTKFSIDKSLSNPNNIGYPEYFTSDAMKNISDEVKNAWPRDYVDEIEKFESFAEVSDRMADTLNRLKKIGDKKYRVIIVTHDAMMGNIAKVFTRDEFSGVNPGEFISLERKDNKLVATRVGNIVDGDSQSDVVEK